MSLHGKAPLDWSNKRPANPICQDRGCDITKTLPESSHLLLSELKPMTFARMTTQDWKMQPTGMPQQWSASAALGWFSNDTKCLSPLSCFSRTAERGWTRWAGLHWCLLTVGSHQGTQPGDGRRNRSHINQHGGKNTGSVRVDGSPQATFPNVLCH